MQHTEDLENDVVQELRLRSWARSHYVPPENRGDDLHPIVLDEMQRRDAEILSGSSAPAREWSQRLSIGKDRSTGNPSPNAAEALA